MPNLKIFQKIKEEEAFSNWLYKTNIILIPKPGIDTTRKENCRPISLRNTNAKLSTVLAHQIQQWIIQSYQQIQKKSIWQNSTSVFDKNSQQIEYRRNISLYRKNHIWQSHSWHCAQWWKVESFSFMIRNKMRFSTLTIPIQHNTRNPSWNNQARKINKRHSNWKGRSKTVFVCRWHDIIYRKP